MFIIALFLCQASVLRIKAIICFSPSSSFFFVRNENYTFSYRCQVYSQIYILSMARVAGAVDVGVYVYSVGISMSF